MSNLFPDILNLYYYILFDMVTIAFILDKKKRQYVTMTTFSLHKQKYSK